MRILTKLGFCRTKTNVDGGKMMDIEADKYNTQILTRNHEGKEQGSLPLRQELLQRLEFSDRNCLSLLKKNRTRQSYNLTKLFPQLQALRKIYLTRNSSSSTKENYRFLRF